MSANKILAYEKTVVGWRGLTERGLVLDVRAGSIPTPNTVIMIGQDAFTLPGQMRPWRLRNYLRHADLALELLKHDQCEQALIEVNRALRFAKTTQARFNRSLILLSLGRWSDGIAEYEHRFELGRYEVDRRLESIGIARWRGESLAGKSLVLTHDEGFGDTIQMLRYVPWLERTGATVTLFSPPSLVRLAAAAGIKTITEWRPGLRFDFFCPVMSIWRALAEPPAAIPRGPYLRVDPSWRQELGGRNGRRRIGIAWAVGGSGEHERMIPLALLADALPGADLYSIQAQGADEARQHGVNVVAFEDFAACAGLIEQMDEIVAVDTAAVHLAGAIGHPRIHVVLPRHASWRWNIRPPLYPGINLYWQTSAGDWPSALAQLPKLHG